MYDDNSECEVGEPDTYTCIYRYEYYDTTGNDGGIRSVPYFSTENRVVDDEVNRKSNSS